MLDGGLGDSRPPRALLWPVPPDDQPGWFDRGGRRERPILKTRAVEDTKGALLLVLDHEMALDGVDRLGRVTGLPAADIEHALFPLAKHPNVYVNELRVIANYGRVLRLDANGREVTP